MFKFVQARNYTKITAAATRDIRLIVIHDMEYPENPGGAEWCADFFAGNRGLTAPKASAHFCIDNDSIVQCVETKDIAWHTPGSLPAKGKSINGMSIGIEHAGYAKQTREQWLDDYSRCELELSAELVAKLCHNYDIPPVYRSADDLKAGLFGITGHADCTKATGVGTHWDPGPNFPWDWYIERVKAHYDLLNLDVPVVLTDDGVEAAGESAWQRVQLDGIDWLVAPTYIWPIAIGQAQEMAAKLGCELPSPALVDAIWKAADVKIDSMQMVRTDHNGTMAEMSSSVLINRQAERLEKLIAGRSYKLLAGYCKDIVNVKGVLGLYGWQSPTGKNIQSFYSGHVRGWIDYSQGLRLVKRA